MARTLGQAERQHYSWGCKDMFDHVWLNSVLKVCVWGGETKKRKVHIQGLLKRTICCLNLYIRHCSLFQIMLNECCLCLLATCLHQDSILFSLSKTSICHPFLSSYKVAHVMCLTGAVCCCGAGSFHCLLGMTESMFSSQVSWKMLPLKGKTCTKSRRGQVNQ